VGPGEDARRRVAGAATDARFVASDTTGYDCPVNTARRRIAAILIGLATAIVIIAIAILPFMTPQWVAFEQERSQATAWAGFTTDQLRTASDAILADLIFGSDYTVQVDGRAVLNEREQAHMADVRTVFRGLWVLAIVSVVVLVVTTRRRDRSATWRAVRGGALGLTVGVVVLGVVALVAFDQLFEAFHEVFFPPGSFLFDPRTDRLVQLFPFQFWQETAIAVGIVIIVIALGVAWVAGRRAAHGIAEAAATPDLATAGAPGR
jgi:integral membrane protein (TIGR01906 family)